MLLRECRTGLLRILCESSRLKLYNIIVEALAQIELYWKVLVMPPLVLDRTVGRMERELDAFRERVSTTVSELGADQDVIIPGLSERLEAELNVFKLDLTSAVTDTFGMDYHYEIEELEQDEAVQATADLPLARHLGEQFARDASGILDDLGATLNRVLLYRNTSTPEVVTHIYALNRLVRQLRRTRNTLRHMEES
jgi:hypothetical protein